MEVVAKTNTPWWQKGKRLTAAREYRGHYVIVCRLYGYDEEIYHPTTAFHPTGADQ